MTFPGHSRTAASTAAGPARAERVLMLNWRDEAHPEGGGSEVYLERIAEHLVADGRHVTIVCSHHSEAPRDEVLPSGVRIVRRGRRYSVYAFALWALATRRLGRPDVVVDVQNGVPFWSPLVTRAPVVLLCHHVHREQWSVVFGRPLSTLGWWLESRLAPRVYRRSQYVTVSDVSRRELVELGVDGRHITVVYNGADAPAPTLAAVASPSGSPTRDVMVLGRLVPHKRVEIALETLRRLGVQRPDLRLVVTGHGYWHDALVEETARLGLQDRVVFTGFVDDGERSRLLEDAEALLMPSIKEGWGLTVMEAALQGTPTVAFSDAGGVTESVVDGVTGLLADDVDEFVTLVGRLLDDPVLRTRMGEQARERAGRFLWSDSARRFADVLDAQLSRRPGDRRSRSRRRSRQREGRSAWTAPPVRSGSDQRWP